MPPLSSEARQRLGIACASHAAADEIEVMAGSAGLTANGIAVRTAAGTTAARTITGTANQVTVVNGDGVAGNPTLSLPAAVNVTTSYSVAGTKVVGAQGVAIPNMAIVYTVGDPVLVPDSSVTFADGAAPTVAELLEAVGELTAKLNVALGALRTHGLIAT
jgi:hypothetical protein